MAKKSTKISKRKQRELLKKSGLSYREINKLSNRKRNEAVEYIVKDVGRKTTNVSRETLEKSYRSYQKKSYKRDLRNRKFHELTNLGIEPERLTTRVLDRIKVKDIVNHNISRENYSFLYGIDKFDFDKIYALPDGKAIYIAYRDFSNERTFEDILNDFKGRSPEQLLEFLQGIVDLPPTYQKGKKNTSSGKAGDYKFMLSSRDTISAFNNETRKANRKTPKNKRKHTEDYKGFQVLKDGRFNSFRSFTTRNLLVVANAIMYNVTEQNRISFYNRFYSDICRNVPELKSVLPKPKY